MNGPHSSYNYVENYGVVFHCWLTAVELGKSVSYWIVMLIFAGS